MIPSSKFGGAIYQLPLLSDRQLNRAEAQLKTLFSKGKTR